MKHLFLLFYLLPLHLWANQASIEGTIRNAETNEPLAAVEIYVQEINRIIESDERGAFRLTGLSLGQYTLTVFAPNYNSYTQSILLDKARLFLDIRLSPLSADLAAVEVFAQTTLSNFRYLRAVEGTAIYAAKKSEIIELDGLVANLATNNAREIYRSVAGLNVWENDGAGLQLAIGARGLDPNRTSSFNTRQNGFDISADALGYPESYYTPPTQALERIEIVRGAASLQYGTQFGGLLNFKLKKGKPDKVFECTSENTLGSFGLFNSFNSIGGTKGKFNYYAFYQHKQGDGWRDNANFKQNTAYLNVDYDISPKFKIGLELTQMNYLAQQAAGLTEADFTWGNPRESKRDRNWFAVDWKLAALHLDYKISKRTQLNFRNFVLDARRQALGELGRIDRADPLRERDLIVGDYENFGSEGRLIHRYKIKERVTNFLVGYRYYQGLTRNQQGDASEGSDADFRFLHPENLEKSNYKFPSRNLAFFAENLFNIAEKWTLTPGLRYEFIRTASEGFYRRRVFAGWELLLDEIIPDARSNERQFVLFGLGAGYRVSNEVEAYANLSQNYRAINFSDLALVNPNLLIDSQMQDEKGYNADAGIRGTMLHGLLRFDASLFYLRYNNRIGLADSTILEQGIIEKTVAYRTNIGNARILGLEAYIEADIWRLWKGKEQALSLRPYLNFSLLQGKYLSGRTTFIGKAVELIPPINLKTGLSASYKKWQANYLFTYVHQHFSDATNAIAINRTATRGRIPSYSVMDISTTYSFGRFRLQTGINNLLNRAYFTRLATGYPGPGIIPSDGRAWYLSFRVKI